MSSQNFQKSFVGNWNRKVEPGNDSFGRVSGCRVSGIWVSGYPGIWVPGTALIYSARQTNQVASKKPASLPATPLIKYNYSISNLINKVLILDHSNTR